MALAVPPSCHNEVAPATRRTSGSRAHHLTRGSEMVERICSDGDCDKKAHARGLCPMHYQRLRLHGSTGTPPPAKYAPWKHGTSQGYNYHQCRCEKCRAWVREYQREWQIRRRATNLARLASGELSHGRTGYIYGCRCEVCSDAASNASSSWYERNTEHAKNNASRNGEVRRARQRNLPAFKVSEREWRRLCQRYDNRCAYCGERNPLQREHVIPISRGGQHSIGNLLPACKLCNLAKGTKLLAELKYRI